MAVIHPTYEDIQTETSTHALDILGGFHLGPDDKTPPECKTLLLLGPGSDFWLHINASDEMKDGESDPIDRWSTRTVGSMAAKFGATPAFPFGGPPYQPFYTWALRTDRVWSSPVMLAVHDIHGLFVSFRGALLLPYAIDLPKPPTQSPCEACPQPCLTTCPVQALTDNGYELEACHSYLDTEAGQSCMSGGCAVRRACPVGQVLRDPVQSAYHMSVFHK